MSVRLFVLHTFVHFVVSVFACHDPAVLGSPLVLMPVATSTLTKTWRICKFKWMLRDTPLAVVFVEKGAKNIYHEKRFVFYHEWCVNVHVTCFFCKSTFKCIKCGVLVHTNLGGWVHIDIENHSHSQFPPGGGFFHWRSAKLQNTTIDDHALAASSCPWSTEIAGFSTGLA